MVPALLALPPIGCAASEPRIDLGTAPGHLVLLPGVEGNAWQLANMCNGLRDAGVDWTIEIIPWGSPPFHSLQNLTDYPANRARAKRISARLRQLRTENPDHPLVLCGYSGGGGLAVLAAEALDAEVTVDRIILIAAAISNEYDPTDVTARCRDRLVNIYSPRDRTVGWGTKLFGTIDRRKTLSAGHTGFVDADGSLRCEDGLMQIGWRREWRKAGHSGAHTGYLHRRWARQYLAPIIRGAWEEWREIENALRLPEFDTRANGNRPPSEVVPRRRRA